MSSSLFSQVIPQIRSTRHATKPSNGNATCALTTVKKLDSSTRSISHSKHCRNFRSPQVVVRSYEERNLSFSDFEQGVENGQFSVDIPPEMLEQLQGAMGRAREAEEESMRGNHAKAEAQIQAALARAQGATNQAQSQAQAAVNQAQSQAQAAFNQAQDASAFAPPPPPQSTGGGFWDSPAAPQSTQAAAPQQAGGFWDSPATTPPPQSPAPQSTGGGFWDSPAAPQSTQAAAPQQAPSPQELEAMQGRACSIDPNGGFWGDVQECEALERLDQIIPVTHYTSPSAPPRQITAVPENNGVPLPSSLEIDEVLEKAPGVLKAFGPAGMEEEVESASGFAVELLRMAKKTAHANFVSQMKQKKELDACIARSQRTLKVLDQCLVKVEQEQAYYVGVKKMLDMQERTTNYK